MIDIWAVLTILFIHWFADAIVQTEWQAVNKHNNLKALLSHTLSYTTIWALFGMFFMVLNIQHNWIADDGWMLSKFLFVTFIIHTVTDFLTSKVNHKLAEETGRTGKYHNFFVAVLFDQFLHYAQLFLTIYHLL